MEHIRYNTTNYPHRVGNNGNWDIYRNDDGACASIPTPAAALQGCQATHFGDMKYVKEQLGDAWLEQQTTGQLAMAPDVRTTVSLSDDPSGEVYQVLAWLTDTAGTPLQFCAQEAATHVLGRSLWTGSLAVKDVTIPLTNLKVEGLRRLAHWRLREQALALGTQGARLGDIQLKVID